MRYKIKHQTYFTYIVASIRIRKFTDWLEGLCL